MDASARDVRQRRCSVACRTRCQVSSRAGFGRELDEPIALPNGRYAPMTLAAPPMRFELRRPLAAGPMQERIHGLS
jgi:hypothetical protein